MEFKTPDNPQYSKYEAGAATESRATENTAIEHFVTENAALPPPTQLQSPILAAELVGLPDEKSGG